MNPREAERFSRYLVGVVASPALCERYAAGVAELGLFPSGRADAWALSLAQRRDWTIGPLDAACAILHSGWALRRRLILLSAVLEASPAHADDYIPQPRGTLSVLAVCVVEGVAGVVNLLLGLVLLLLAPKGRAA
ncbi:MAG: hypothetical protein WC718_12680 [Phycisphaerales bacterium]